MFHLPPELLELILNHLYLPWVSYPSCIDDHPSSQETGFETSNIVYPTENDYDRFRAALNLSSTCKIARKILAPRVFRTIHLTPRDRNVASVLAVSQSWISKYVEDVRYEAKEEKAGGFMNVTKDRTGHQITQG
jgi:hypothetical protein